MGGRCRVARAAPAGRRRLGPFASIAEGPLGPRAAGYPQRAAGLIHISTATRNAPRAAGLGVYLVHMRRAILSTGHATAPAGLVWMSTAKHRRHQTTGHVQETGATCTKHQRTTCRKPAPPAPNHGPRPACNCFGSGPTFGCRTLHHVKTTAE